jgi:hypothetical protein
MLGLAVSDLHSAISSLKSHIRHLAFRLGRKRSADLRSTTSVPLRAPRATADPPSPIPQPSPLAGDGEGPTSAAPPPGRPPKTNPRPSFPAGEGGSLPALSPVGAGGGPRAPGVRGQYDRRAHRARRSRKAANTSAQRLLPSTFSPSRPTTSSFPSNNTLVSPRLSGNPCIFGQ